MLVRNLSRMLIALLLVLTACGGAEEAPTATTAPPASETSPPPVPTDTPIPTPTEEPRAQGILFSSTRGGGLNIFVLDPESGEIQALTEGYTFAAFGTWSPDASQISFASNDSGSWRVFVMDPDGGNLTMVTDFSSAVASWFPSGDRLLFNSDSQGEPPDVPDLYAMNLDGSDLVQIIDVNDVADYAGVVSPDGTQIAFTSDRTGREEIFVANVDGSGVTQLTDEADGNYGPDWSPDGTQILFTAVRGPSAYIYVMDADGSNLMALTDSGADNDPAWSPDGTQIVFVSGRSGIPAIWIMDADGGNAVALTEDDAADLLPNW
jgi:Tol biopolymer transport system component